VLLDGVLFFPASIFLANSKSFLLFIFLLRALPVTKYYRFLTSSNPSFPRIARFYLFTFSLIVALHLRLTTLWHCIGYIKIVEHLLSSSIGGLVVKLAVAIRDLPDLR
jgi:hypothetical protein